ncbi:triose-phosphate transporter family-domain-containing protein [Xylogone sp. PMI_703]|nr:triose-phosphate transporter family-domain-containing protein [Xylogone sp. PMI_703]
MPHSTRDTSRTRINTLKFPGGDPQRSSMEKFPDHTEAPDIQQTFAMHSPMPNGSTNGSSSADRWHARRSSMLGGGSSWSNGGRTHSRQKSLSDAFRTIRSRKGSVSANVHEISDALKAPVSPMLIGLCLFWYLSSALTNTSSKSILNTFPKPATLTLIQFAFVSSYCLFFSYLASVYPSLKAKVPALRQGIRYPSRDVIVTTLPLAAFQIGGHLLSSTATAKIPVSLVHTIKGLSPLFTVFAYRVLFDIRYPTATYLSLIPLTLGVMLACSAEFKGNIFGILYAFLAAIIFVTQNIFSKRLFNEAAIAEAAGQYTQSRKLDKLNLLCYSSGLALLWTFPIWFWSEGISLIRDFLQDGSLNLESHTSALDHGRLALEYFFNGTFHFGQNMIAFVLLSMVSPVTYSVASLIKRVFVVVIAIIWFRNPTTKLQAVGIALTFFGLYLYDRTKESNKADRKAKMMDIKEETLLPLTTRPGDNVPASVLFESPVSSTTPHPYTNGYALNPPPQDTKKSDDRGRTGRSRGMSTSWLPPGTKAEDTWKPREHSANRNETRIPVN